MEDSPVGRPVSVVERRKSDRVEIEVRVDYSTVDDFFSDFTQNINEGGMFIETDSPAEIDSVVELRFALPGDEEPVKASGRVVRIIGPGEGGAPGMAIEFEELERDTRDRINEIVKQLRVAPS